MSAAEQKQSEGYQRSVYLGIQKHNFKMQINRFCITTLKRKCFYLNIL